jgi:hypothetical protein
VAAVVEGDDVVEGAVGGGVVVAGATVTVVGGAVDVDDASSAAHEARTANMAGHAYRDRRLDRLR